MANDLSATFGISIPVETNAAEATAELQQLQDQVAQDTQTLRNMNQALRALQASTNVDIATFRQLRDAISAKKVAIAQGTQALAQHKAAFEALNPAEERARKTAESFRKEQEKLEKTRASEVSQGMAHVLGVLSPRFGHAARAAQDFGGAIRTIGAGRALAVGASVAIAAAFVAVAAAAAAVTYAVSKAVKGLVEFGLASANARRDEKLMLQSASATLFWGQATEFAGNQAQLAVDKVIGKVPLARTEVAGFAAQLAKLQFKGQDLEKGLKAVSTAAAAGQDTGAVIGMLQLARVGVGSIDAVADRIEKRFGAIARAKMLSLDVQVTKLKDNFAGLFTKVNPTPFLEGIQKLFSVFEKTSVVGYALRETMGQIFKVLGQDFKSTTPIIETLFKTFVLWALRGVGMALRFRLAIQNFLDEHPKLAKFFGDANTWVTAAQSAFSLLGTTIKTAFGPIGESISMLMKLFDLVGYQGQAEEGGQGIGESFAFGVGQGIRKKISEVGNTIRDFANRGAAIMRGSWGVHSPSTVAENIYERVGDGAVVGVRKSQGKVDAAMAETLGPSSNAVPAAAARGAVGGPVQLHFHITVPPGTKDPEAFGKQVGKGMMSELGEALEQLAHMAGATLDTKAA